MNVRIFIVLFMLLVTLVLHAVYTDYEQGFSTNSMCNGSCKNVTYFNKEPPYYSIIYGNDSFLYAKAKTQDEEVVKSYWHPIPYKKLVTYGLRWKRSKIDNISDKYYKCFVLLNSSKYITTCYEYCLSPEFLQYSPVKGLSDCFKTVHYFRNEFVNHSYYVPNYSVRFLNVVDLFVGIG